MDDRYQVIECVGGGSYADVYKVLDTLTGKIVAKKVLKDPLPANMKRFKRERDMLAAYRTNPYVIDLLDSNLDAPEPYLILEFSEIGSLQQYVANRRAWKQVLRWIRDIALALGPIHARGDWHRDIKPNNILLFRNLSGRVIAKITDFGLAQRIDNSSGEMTDSPYGTKGYIDPIAEFFNKYTWHSDIYSLGKTLKELLTGDKDNGIYPNDVPVQLRVLISRMMSFTRNARPSAENIVKSANNLLRPQQPIQVQQIQPMGWKGLLTLAGASLGILIALTNTNSYDENVGRYRDSNGRFRSGMFF